MKPITVELQRQARWSLDNHRYADREPRSPSAELVLRPSGALDPFSPVEICTGLACRIDAAEQFARSAGLLADRIVLPDVFTRVFAAHEELSTGQAASMLRDIVVLDRLKPLVRAGIIEFGDGAMEYCPVHHAEATRRINEVVDILLPKLEPDLTYRKIDNRVHVRTGILLEPPLHWWSDRNPTGSLRDVALATFRKPLARGIAGILRDMRSAERLGGALASGSRLGLLAIKYIERREVAVDDIEDWEATRSVSLPWVQKLSPHEVVMLRQEAATALPRLRALLSQKLATAKHDKDDAVASIIGELKAEAAEVEAELKALKLPRERGFRTLTGGLGLTIAVYGLAAIAEHIDDGTDAAENGA